MTKIFKWLVWWLLKIPLLKKILIRCYVGGNTEEEALEMVLVLHGMGLGVISDFLGEEVTDSQTAIRVAKTYTCHLQKLGQLRKKIPSIHLAVSIKLTSLGLKFNQGLAARLFSEILYAAQKEDIGFEIDIEGPDTFTTALEAIKILAWEGKPFRVALAANQNFSDKLLEVCLSYHLPIRIVKGAYPGDIKGGMVNKNFISLFSLARSGNLDIAVATHDKKLLKRIAPRFELNIQMLFGVRMFGQKKWADWTYMPWGREAERFLLRRAEEGIHPKVLLLFLLNIFESLLWRAKYVPPR